ncbi:hypothetical protein ISF_01951 [Cordyceps fumosorosea ARSEF 2679]|uniref:AGC-kinase C-terminal domain-containing protein n=1 Tax=Cordyceps fumosorosea (strain ARSEF 2679) TaxID=1081104 RepID=A0A168CI12_CORFA|nr:hypothetical protein ISF_01951 [Cordyceps fumosorosea ARSEF 2679]OAA71400.1 hypothetical protein ISF_01951 [Cordyceps fumosorosea ARSEF 2679]
MLSHLRFHRRGPSNPASPAGDQQQPSPLSNANSPFTPDAVSSPDTQPPTSTTSLVPPTLPPIPRVASDQSTPLPDFSSPSSTSSHHHGLPTIEQQQRGSMQPPPARSPYTNDSGFIGGVALENYRRGLRAQRSFVTPENHAAPQLDDQQLRAKTTTPASAASAASAVGAPSSVVAPRPSIPPQSFSKVPSHSSISPSDGAASFQPTGRRPAGLGLAGDFTPSSYVTITPMEPHKAKKGLPFLKNPMSTLLMRRKANQNPPEPLPTPALPSQDSEPAYDPRIKGTRVHDFSAPRRRSIPRNDSSQTITRPSPSEYQGGSVPAPAPAPFPVPTPVPPPAHEEAAPEPVSNQASTPDYLSKNKSLPPAPFPEMRNGSFRDRMRSSSGSSMSTTQHENLSSIAEDNAHRESDSFRRANPSTRTTRSRKISLSEMSSRDTMTSLPRHMKSTSSRFSFDMIGAAKQEKIMEERHRQRQLEKGEPESTERRDSRFDEFDEDAFDYDAMMDDDGLEERIPGVNADFDEEDDYLNETPYIQEDQFDAQDDPDNDQQNFSGFVFQRSNPESALASPALPGQMPNTPRDAHGHPIGSALTKDTPTTATFPLPAQTNPDDMDLAFSQQLSGLAVNEHTPLTEEERTPGARTNVLGSVQEDELYFDDGIIGYEDEFAEDLAAGIDPNDEPFDESIFDNDDTDQFGRPVPGAFAHAQSMRKSDSQLKKRESDMTSRFSAQSGQSQSTAHTSYSAGMADAAHGGSSMISPLGRVSSMMGPSSTPSQRKMAAYQAALAAAAHEAAASGKFQRSASPVLEDEEESEYSTEDLEDAEKQESTVKIQDDVEYEPTGDIYDDLGYENMDDFELDDDAIIAEANASALANDSDGWYGQEFGFYAAPTTQHQGSYSSSASGSTEYQYSNGGFFGPRSDLARTASGRLISREPNLTPITERSEYSNRNSIMSMALPPIVGGTPTVQSPGLAQLAMMSGEGDEMTLSALLRLRNKAWGGSQASLSSSREGSPKSERGELPSSPWAANTASMPGPTHKRQNSLLSSEGRDSELGSLPGSPTLTMANAALGLQAQSNALAAFQQQQQQQGNPVRGNSAPSTYPPPRAHNGQSISAPVSAAPGRNSSEWTWSPEVPNAPARAASLSRQAKGHRRQQSSTESVSYIMEEEDNGEARWIMERRRTGDDNETELLEREIIPGGRI